MYSFSPPLRDIQYVLEDIVGIEDLSLIRQFAEATPDIARTIVDEVGRLATGTLSPLNAPGDRCGASLDDGSVSTAPGFKDAYTTFSEAGWIGLTGASEFGGQGLPQTFYAPVQEMLCSANLSFALCPTLTIGAAEAIHAHGSEKLKATYLKKLISGEWTGTMNLTEPQAGSDVGALRTKASRQSDGSWLIEGQKIFITYGDHDLSENIVHLVLAREEGAPAGTRGISLFVVPKFLPKEGGVLSPNDVQCVSLEHKLGIHASPTCVMSYGDNKSCKGFLLGEEGQGLACMFTMMNVVRLHVGLQGLGLAEAASQLALNYAQDRIQGVPVGSSPGASAPIIEHADVRRMIMNMRTKVQAARAICYMNAKAIDLSQHHADKSERQKYQSLADFFTPLSKAYSTDIGVEVASDAVQVFGGMGFIEETGIAQFYRDARILPIYEGTNGIQAWDLANRKLKQDRGAFLFAFMDEIESFISKKLVDQPIGDIGNSLMSSVTAIRKVGTWFLEQHTIHPRSVAAGATAFLRLTAETTGAYLLAKGASKARYTLAQSMEEHSFYEAQITKARYFAEKVLPLSLACVGPIMSGDDILYDLSAEQM